MRTVLLFALELVAGRELNRSRAGVTTGLGLPLANVALGAGASGTNTKTSEQVRCSVWMSRCLGACV